MASSRDEFADEYYEEKRRRNFAAFFKIRNWASMALVLFWLFFMQVNPLHTLPSRLGSEIGLGLIGLLAVAAGVTVARSKRPPPRADGEEPYDKLTATIGAVLVCVTLLPGIVFNLVIGTYTEITGTPGQQMEIIKYWRSSGRYSCSGPEIDSVFFDDNIVCLDRSHRREFPEGGHMYLSGPVSALGMNVRDAVAHW